MSKLMFIGALLLFLLFLLLAIINYRHHSQKKFLFFLISTLLMTVPLLMYFFNNLEDSHLTINQKTSTSQTEETEKNRDTPPSSSEKENIENEANENPPHEFSPNKEEPQKPKSSPTKEQPEKEEKPLVIGIQVPDNGTVEYTVVKGDTLWSIFKLSGKSVEKIKQWNGLRDDGIYVGQKLKLYGIQVEPKQPPPVIDPTPPQITASKFISNGSTLKKRIAFTFDAGSDIAGISILDVLKKHQIKATFFLTGKWVEKYPALARRIVNEGHEIGNHTHSHPDVKKVSAAVFIEDIKKAEKIILNTTGKSPTPYFRFPYGSYNTEALKTVGAAGYRYSIQWSLDTIDWQQPTVNVINARILSGASNGDIVLMHIGGINTPTAVDQVIPQLKMRGYELVTLSVLLN